MDFPSDSSSASDNAGGPLEPLPKERQRRPDVGQHVARLGAPTGRSNLNVKKRIARFKTNAGHLAQRRKREFDALAGEWDRSRLRHGDLALRHGDGGVGPEAEQDDPSHVGAERKQHPNAWTPHGAVRLAFSWPSSSHAQRESGHSLQAAAAVSIAASRSHKKWLDQIKEFMRAGPSLFKYI